jgi:hypothetical protein
MSSWHRENPELAGTDADPWMQNEGHRRAYEELRDMGLIFDEDRPFRSVVRLSEDDRWLDELRDDEEWQ